MTVKLVIPTDPTELESMLSDSAKLKNLHENGQFGEFIKAYAGAVKQKDTDLSAQISEQVQAGLAEFLKDNRVANSNLSGLKFDGDNKSKALTRGGKGVVYNKRAPGATIDDAKGSDGAPLFRDAAEFLQATWDKMSRLPNRAELGAKLEKLQEIQNSYGTQVPGDGGFLVPESLRSDLLQVSLESSIVRPNATVIPMETAQTSIPFVDSTTDVGSVLGGVVVYWTEEAQLLTESQGSFGQVKLDAHKLTAYAEIPSELMMDAPAFMGYFDQTFPRALAFGEDLAFMVGSGVDRPLGFINCPASVAVAATAGQGANTLVWENIVSMYSRMLPSSLPNAVWIADISTFPQLATMALSVGTGGNAVWLSNGQQGPPVTILGRPVYFTEKPSVLGTTGDLNFVDLSYYLVGDRQQLQVASSTDYKFGNDKIAFRAIQRVDGRPWIQSAITPANGGPTLSPFVQLSSTRT